MISICNCCWQLPQDCADAVYPCIAACVHLTLNIAINTDDNTREAAAAEAAAGADDDGDAAADAEVRQLFEDGCTSSSLMAPLHNY